MLIPLFHEYLDLYKKSLTTKPQIPIGITTNGTVKSNGHLVMGKGVAKIIANYFPELPQLLGNIVYKNGNNVNYISEYNLFTFPVKHNWYEYADLNLIDKSAGQLKELMIFHKLNSVILPKPGCANGGLVWSQVEPILNFYFGNLTELTLYYLDKPKRGLNGTV